MHRLSSKVVVITGSSSGLGRAIALAFAAEDAKLIVCADLNPAPRSLSDGGEPTHERICRQWGAGKAVFIKTDVTVAREVEAAVQEVVRKGGALHV